MYTSESVKRCKCMKNKHITHIIRKKKGPVTLVTGPFSNIFLLLNSFIKTIKRKWDMLVYYTIFGNER